jgi:hypothetical protein
VDSSAEGERRYRRTLIVHACVILGYLFVSLLFWWRVWVTGHPTSTVTCGCGDPVQEMWWLEWLPWAIVHGHNPLLTNALFARQGGANALSNTSWMLPSAILSPITEIFGPVAAFNVLNLLCPVASGWALFLASGKLTRFLPARVLAGALFGFCPFIVGNMVFGHVNFTLDVFPPLVFLLLVKLITESTSSPRRVGLALGLLVAAQFFVGIELLAMTAFAALVAGVVAIAQAPHRAWAIRTRLVVASGFAALVAGAVLSYPIWFMLEGPRHVVGPFIKTTPNDGSALSTIVNAGPAHSPSLATELVGYNGPSGPLYGFLGLALLVLLGASVLVWRRRRLSVVVAVTGAVLWLCSLGVYYPGSQHIDSAFRPTSTVDWGPWVLLQHVPLLNDVLPVRFSLLVALAAAFLLAASMDGWSHLLRERVGRNLSEAARRRVIPALITAVATATLVPIVVAYSVPLTMDSSPIPAWFHNEAPRLPPNTVVLTIPLPDAFYSNAMYWQAVDRLHFALMTGWVYTPGADRVHDTELSPVGGGIAVLNALSTGFTQLPALSQHNVATLRKSVAGWLPLDVVVVRGAPGGAGAAAYLTAALGQKPTFLDGVWYWHLAHMTKPFSITNATLSNCILKSLHVDDPNAAPSCVADSG